MRNLFNAVWQLLKTSCISFFIAIWNIIKDIFYFNVPWLLLLGLLITSVFLPNCPRLFLGLMVLFLVVLIIKPMHVIYGLIGTRGNITSFFFLFLLINIIFSGIYHHAFFKDSGITYDVNQPHIEFNMFSNQADSIRGLSVECQGQHEMLPNVCNDSVHYYYRIEFRRTLQNTILTSLMQEPTDFFSISSTYTGLLKSKPKLCLSEKGEVEDKAETNYSKTTLFHWFLIFHILISWILLGVFISLIYQKFRNN